MSLGSSVPTLTLSLWPWIRIERSLISSLGTGDTDNQESEGERHIYPRGIPKEPVSPDKVDKAEMAFKLYDKDKDGYVTKGEMNRLARKLTTVLIDKVSLYIPVIT